MNMFQHVFATGCLLGVFIGARAEDPVVYPQDNDFLVKVGTCNHAAIAISKIAASEGSADVKSFAEEIRMENKTCYEKVAELLKTRKVGVAAGTEPELKAEIRRLSDLKGNDFDREYLKWVIKENKAGKLLLDNQVKVGKDQDVVVFAKESLETNAAQLKKARELVKATETK